MGTPEKKDQAPAIPEIPKSPGQLVETFDLPIGVNWGSKLYTRLTLRAQQFGDTEAAVDLLSAEGKVVWSAKDSDKDGSAGVHLKVPTLSLAAKTMLVRITRIETANGKDALTGETLSQALAGAGLHPADGQAIQEADARLEKRLPGVKPGSASKEK